MQGDRKPSRIETTEMTNIFVRINSTSREGDKQKDGVAEITCNEPCWSMVCISIAAWVNWYDV